MELAVIGAGVAGCGCAYAIDESQIDVTIYEAQSRLGGRTATHRRAGCRYDTGANYIKHADGRPTSFLHDLPAADLIDIELPVWVFTGDGTIGEGDNPPEDRHKWTYTTGIQTLAAKLLEASNASLELNCPIGSISWEDEWILTDPDGSEIARVSLLLLTPPGPETADLFPTGPSQLHPLRDAAAAIPYRPIRTLALHYEFPIDRPYYALVNPDGSHPVGWVSREECKQDHVPPGETLLIAQMAPEWSAEHSGASARSAGLEAAGYIADLMGEDRFTDPNWITSHHWPRALPDTGLPDDVAVSGESMGVFVAGDWVAGEGRVHHALQTGLEAANRITTTYQ